MEKEGRKEGRRKVMEWEDKISNSATGFDMTFLVK